MSDQEPIPPMPRWYGPNEKGQRPDPSAPSGDEPLGRQPPGDGSPTQDADPSDPPEDLPTPPSDVAGDLGPAQAARQAGSALFGRDLVQPGRGWPFGAAARERREQRAAIRERTRERRHALAEQWHGTPSAPLPGRWAPVSRGVNARVIAALVTVVAVVMALGWWASSRQSQPTPPAAAPRPVPPVTSTPPSAAPVTPSSPTRQPSVSPRPGASAPVPPRAPIPSGGVAPIVPPAPQPGPDPGSIATMPVPGGPPSPAELSTPEKAAAAWMARWCPFDYRKPYGTSQRRARAAMTELGWNAFNPADSQRGRASWAKTVAARETARCSAPTARIVPEAPRSPEVAMVQITAQRVITGPGAPPYVATLTQTRIVKRGSDGLWRVGTTTRGG